MLQFHVLGTVDLRDDGRREIRGLSQSKLFGLLSYLVLAKPYGYQRRDRLAALFWPELDDAHARAALSRAIYQLRSVLGADVIISRGDEALLIARSQLRCDAVLMEELHAAREWRQALELYHGDLLAGLHVASADSDFDLWLEERRADLRRTAADAAWHLVEQMEATDRLDDAVRYARRFIALRPGEETALRHVLQLLDRAGDKAAAAGVYREFANRLASEFELEPSAETRQLLERIRARATDPVASTTAPPAHAASLPAADPAAVRPVATQPVRRTRTMWYAVAAVVALTIGLRFAWAHDDPLPTLAVGHITSALPADSIAGFTTLLTINMGRIQSLDVVSERRISELQAVHRDRSAIELARLAGADEVLEGVLSRRGGELRLDVRRITIRDGRTRKAYTIEGRDLFQLADLLAEHIARDLGLAAPAQRREATTTSIIAYHLYEQGLKTFNEGDRQGALRFFNAALAEDSTFAMAALYAALAADGHAGELVMQRAVRLAEHAGERERLLINALWSARMLDPRLAMWAESLAYRYPNEPDGQLLLARALHSRGDTAGAFMHLKRVVALDTVNLGTTERCRACEAINSLVGFYLYMDSIDQAESIARTWTRLQPKAPGAWMLVSWVMEYRERYPEALAAMDSFIKYNTDTDAALAKTSLWYRTGDYDLIDNMWRELQASPKPMVREHALWTRVIASRTQGRLRDALQAAREYRPVATASNAGDRYGGVGHGRLEAVVLLDMGEACRAALLWDSIADAELAPMPTRAYASRAVYWTYAASAYAAAGDTARLRVLEDSIRVNGAQIESIRHQRLHHYVRGLRLAAQQQHNEAVVQFHRAITAREGNYVRLYLDLAKSLLASGRHAEAIPPLVYALRGPVSAAGLYAARPDLWELLGLAYERNNQPDSALIQYRNVLYAWRHADPELGARKARIQARVAALSGARPIPR
ncbi:MAG TPA: BTAD domain-containing putative transcriptional regulator [Longimicrobiales bacterium]|nr:BTAD domain-containing putative transcriptional regulator [Longimicrobiales bacterium]